MNGAIRYRLEADNGSEFSVALSTPHGSQLWLAGTSQGVPTRSGTKELATNEALCKTAWSFGQTEHEVGHCTDEEDLRRLQKLAQRQARSALTYAAIAENLTAHSRKAWCSACIQFTTHRRSALRGMKVGTYLCMLCGATTTPCAVHNCSNMAFRGKGSLPGPRYCAEHRHDIPGFAKANSNLNSLEEYESLLAHDKHNASRTTRLAVGTVVAGAVVGPAAYFAAPLIGGALGASALGGGLSGAAATSHGLAMLGGGSLAAGGAGMAGGVIVVTATGASLGGSLGLSVVNAYARSDKSFRIQKLRDGTGPPVLLASGFLTQKDDGWGTWRRMVDQCYPNSPVYRVHWGAKDLKTLSVFLAGSGGKWALKTATVKLGEHASKKAAAPLGLLSVPFMAADLLKNPWHVARARADMTGVVLADLIARSPGRCILVGHSLGGAVMLSAARVLGTRLGDPKLEDVHLLGAAVNAGGDWRLASHAVSGRIWNYYSERDAVLSKAFTLAQGGKKAIGGVGMCAPYHNIRDCDVSSNVDSHGEYTDRVILKSGSSDPGADKQR